LKGPGLAQQQPDTRRNPLELLQAQGPESLADRGKVRRFREEEDRDRDLQGIGKLLELTVGREAFPRSQAAMALKVWLASSRLNPARSRAQVSTVGVIGIVSLGMRTPPC
jgi:hypothetical protein